MKQNLKRLTALILVFALSISLLSVNIWAAEVILDDSTALTDGVENEEERQEAEESLAAQSDTRDNEISSEDVLSDIEMTIGEEVPPTQETSPSLAAQQNGAVELLTNSEENSGVCGPNLSWSKDTKGELIIRGSGKMDDYGGLLHSGPYLLLYSSAPWHNGLPGGGGIQSIIIQNGVTSIGTWAFYGCRSLVCAYISDSVTTIGNYAFDGCDKLEDIYFSGSEAQWKAINTGSDNSVLSSATIHFNYELSQENGNGFTIGVDTNNYSNNVPSFFAGSYTTKEEINKRFILNPFQITSDVWIAMNGKKVTKSGSQFYVVDEKVEPQLFTYSISDSFEQLVSNEDLTVKSDIQKNMSKKWNGACYGIAVSMALASQGVNLSEAGITTNYFSAGKPKDNKKLRDTIHYYQLSLYTNKGRKTEEYTKPNYFSALFSNNTNLHSFLMHLVNEGRRSQEEQKPFILSFYTSEGGHAIVAYNINELGENKYEISLYDENGSYTSKLLINLNTDQFSFKEGNPSESELHATINNDNCTSLSYVGISDLYERISTLSIGDDTSNYARIAVSADKKCKIVNNEGKTLIYDGESYSGTMNVFDADIRGEDAYKEIVFYVSPYTSLSMSDIAEKVELSATIDGEYYSVEVTEADSVSISPKDISITGDQYYFETFTSAGVINKELVSVSAYASGDTDISAAEAGITVDTTGSLSYSTVTSYEDENTDAVEISGTSEQINIIDSGNSEIQIDPVVIQTDINTCDSILGEEFYTYDGNEKTPIVTITNGSTVLTDGIDYTVSYNNNINAGIGQVLITGIGNYCGTITKSFTIQKASIDITATNITKNASTKEQTIALGATATGGTLSYVSDNSKITIKDGKAVVPANFTGKTNITIIASGECYNTATKTIVLAINKVANTITASNFTKTYSTKAQSFSIGATRKGSGALTYSSDNKSVTVDKDGKVTVKAKFIGKATITIKVAAKGIYKEATKKIIVTVNPTKTTLTSAVNAKGLKMTVKWKKNSVGIGYEIQYSIKKDFSSGNKTVSVTKNSTVSKTITGLTKGKTYYVRIRTYKTVSKVKYYSGWSAVKSVKISK